MANTRIIHALLILALLGIFTFYVSPIQYASAITIVDKLIMSGGAGILGQYGYDSVSGNIIAGYTGNGTLVDSYWIRKGSDLSNVTRITGINNPAFNSGDQFQQIACDTAACFGPVLDGSNQLTFMKLTKPSYSYSFVTSNASYLQCFPTEFNNEQYVWAYGGACGKSGILKVNTAGTSIGTLFIKRISLALATAVHHSCTNAGIMYLTEPTGSPGVLKRFDTSTETFLGDFNTKYASGTALGIQCDSSGIYLAIGAPLNQVRKFSLAGVSIWNASLTNAFKLYLTTNNVYASATSSSVITQFQKSDGTNVGTWTVPNSAVPILVKGTYNSTAIDYVASGGSNSVKRMGIINQVETDATGPPPPSPTPTGGIDCTLPENVNILICRLGGNGEAGSAGAFVIGNISQGTGILGLGCSMGIVNCVNDPNPRTNGLGLLIFIAAIFVIVGMFFAGIGGINAFQLPVFIWVIIIMALAAFFTITGLIEPVFLILAIIAIVALAAPKILNTIRGGNTLGGGSTE